MTSKLIALQLRPECTTCVSILCTGQVCVLKAVGLQVKGQMYGNSFHPDPEIYMANQHVAFGVPQLANAIPIPAAS